MERGDGPCMVRVCWCAGTKLMPPTCISLLPALHVRVAAKHQMYTHALAHDGQLKGSISCVGGIYHDHDRIIEQPRMCLRLCVEQLLCQSQARTNTTLKATTNNCINKRNLMYQHG